MIDKPNNATVSRNDARAASTRSSVKRAAPICGRASVDCKSPRGGANSLVAITCSGKRRRHSTLEMTAQIDDSDRTLAVLRLHLVRELFQAILARVGERHLAAPSIDVAQHVGRHASP